MPLYRCTCPEGDLNDQQRAAIAQAITAIHCDVTQAPPTFVHVQFHDRKPQAVGTRFTLHGGVRAGRSGETNELLISRCVGAVAAIAGVAPGEITMRTSATPASWILEGGRVMPEPGEEAAWIAAHA